MRSYAGVRRAMYEMPWMMIPSRIFAAADLVEARARGGRRSAQERVALAAERRNAEVARTGGVAIIPVYDTILPRFVGMEDLCGGTSMEEFGRAFMAAVQDPEVSDIVLPFDTPGGSVFGVEERFRMIYAARGVKPVHAVGVGQVASAGMYLFAAAEHKYLSPSSEAGSVGVYMMHQNIRAMLAMEGVEVTFVYEGEHKVEGNPFEALPASAREHMQKRTRDYYEMFTAACALGCGVTVDHVLENFGQGRMYGASEAVERGMADEVATLDEVLVRLGARGIAPPEEDEEPDADDLPPLLRSLPAGAESRTIGSEARTADGDEGERLEGTALRFGSLSLDLGGFREEFEPGAFADSVAADDIRVEWQHDARFVFGRTSAGTARVWEDAQGLHYTASPPDAQWARDAMASIRRGDITQNSFAFRVLEVNGKRAERWERRDGQVVRVISRAQLFEVGPQTHPAYPDTSVAVRGLRAYLAAETATMNAVAPVAAAAHENRRRKLELIRAECS